MEQAQKINRIPSVVAGLMISVALLIDLLQLGLNFIPFIGNLMASAVEVFAFLTYFLWFKFRGVKYNGKKSAITFGAALIEFIPLLNALPALTISVVAMIGLTKTEDLFSRKIEFLKTSANSAQRKTRIQQKSLMRKVVNEENYTKNNSQNSDAIPVNTRQNPPLINRDFKGIASSDDSSRFIKAA